MLATSRKFPFPILLAAGLLPAAWGCSSTDDAKVSAPVVATVMQPACGSSDDPTCPNPMPSYRTDVAPILDAKCNTCHTGAKGKPWALTSYQDLNDWRTQLLGDLLHCTMPPVDAGTQLSADERSKVIGWLACKAPNN